VHRFSELLHELFSQNYSPLACANQRQTRSFITEADPATMALQLVDQRTRVQCGSTRKMSRDLRMLQAFGCDPATPVAQLKERLQEDRAQLLKLAAAAGLISVALGKAWLSEIHWSQIGRDEK
jgi:hypothetical protein